MRIQLCAAALACLASAASATSADDILQLDYQCERGVGIQATYINVAGESFAIVQAEGRQLAMKIVPAASGAKYSVDAGKSGPVWWTRGETAMLSWFDADTSEEVTLYKDCNAKE